MLPAVVLLTAVLQPALGWGGLFNRFSPEMLSNLGYGGHGTSLRVQPFLQRIRNSSNGTYWYELCTYVQFEAAVGDYLFYKHNPGRSDHTLCNVSKTPWRSKNSLTMRIRNSPNGTYWYELCSYVQFEAAVNDYIIYKHKLGRSDLILCKISKTVWGSEDSQSVNQGPMETLHDLQESEIEGPCYGKRCTANEHCCAGYVCVDVDGGGSCMFPYGLGQGELCRRHSDCETGLVCSDTGEGSKTCMPPFTAPKQYSEECTMSSECDIHRGLCCQFQRRHRQVARKMCSYFTDPMVCIGPVASDHAKVEIERTAGEKRITGKTPVFL